MKLKREDTAALLIDMQGKLLQSVANSQEISKASVRFLEGLRILEVPVLPVRQYPKGLGDYPPALWEAIGQVDPLDKVTFSAWDTPEIAQEITALNRKNLLVFGVEAHVCVLQTVLDLLDNGYHVTLVADCVSSRAAFDCEIALRRAEQAGAMLATSEGVLFELLGKAGSDTFKQISNLIKG